MQTRIGVWIACVATLIWGTVLIAALGIYQRGQYQEVALGIVQVLYAVAIAGGIIAAGTGLGAVLVYRLNPDIAPAEKWLLAVIAGVGLWGTLWLWLGMVWLPTLPVTVLLLGIGIVLLWRYRGRVSVPSSANRADQKGAVVLWRQFPLPAKLFIGGMILVPFIQALTPPTSFDALLYHLRLPTLWLAQGSVFQAAKDSPFFHPMVVEALFTIALQFGTDTAPQIIHWLFLPLSLAFLWRLTRDFLPTVSPVLTLVLALSIQMVPLLSGYAYNDIALACFQIACIWAMLRWRTTQQGVWLVWAGLFGGLGMGVKYLAVFTPVLVTVLIALVSRRDFKTALRQIVTFGLIVGVVAAPSYIRNFIATGNPVFPFALPSPYWDSFRAAWYAANGTGIGWSLPDLLSLPFTVTIAANHDTSYYDARPGPLIATFLPLSLIFLALRKDTSQVRSVIGWLLFFVGGYFVVWVLGIINSAALWQGRFLILPLFLCCPIVAWGLTQLATFDTPRFSLSGVATLFVGLWAGFALLIATAELIATDPITAIFAADHTTWQREQLPGYADLVIESQRLTPDNRLLLWFEPRSYQMPLNTQPDTLLYEFSWRLNRAQGDVAQLDTSLCKEGFSHVGIYWSGVDFLYKDSIANPLSDTDYNALQTWRTRHTSIWKDVTNQYELFALECP